MGHTRCLTRKRISEINKMNSKRSSASSNYTLTEAERRYLLTGKTGSYTEPQLQERIQSKAESIDIRMQVLIQDAILLRSEGVFDRLNGDLRDRLEQVNPEVAPVHSNPRSTSEILDDGVGLNYEIKQGYTDNRALAIGRLIRALYGREAAYQNREQICWGLINGAFGHPGQYSPEFRQSLKQLFRNLSGRIEDRGQEADLFEKVEEYVNLREWYSEQIGKIIHDTIEDPEADLLENLPAHFGRGIDERILYRLHEVGCHLENSLPTLKDTSWRGVDASAVVSGVWQSARPVVQVPLPDSQQEHRMVSSNAAVIDEVATDDDTLRDEISFSVSDVASQIGAKDKLVSKIINDMTGDGKAGQKWELHPLIESVQNGYSLTEYGALVAYCYCELENPLTAVYALAFEDPIDLEFYEIGDPLPSLVARTCSGLAYDLDEDRVCLSDRVLVGDGGIE